MTFKSIRTAFLALSAASILGVAALLFDLPVPHLALLCLMLLISAAFGAVILTYKDVPRRLRIEGFVGIAAFTTLANALDDIYGAIALAGCLLPVALAMLYRYGIKRY